MLCGYLEDERSSRLFLMTNFQRPAMYFALFCCCEGSLLAGKPKRQIFIYVFDLSNPGFRASKNRAMARFFERISFLYPQDGTPEGIRTPDLLVRSQTLYPAELLAHKSDRLSFPCPVTFAIILPLLENVKCFVCKLSKFWKGPGRRRKGSVHHIGPGTYPAHALLPQPTAF